MPQLALSPGAAIDLHLHTHYSDGDWTPEDLLDHLAGEGFALAAIADHDRVDTVAGLQQVAAARRLPLLAAVEMSAAWKGELTDLLCYGFDPGHNALAPLTQDLLRRQQANTRLVFERLLEKGLSFPSRPGDAPPYAEALTAITDLPASRQLHALVGLVKQHGYGTPEVSAGRLVVEAGGEFITHDPAQVAEAAHQSGAVCLLAHPGRGDGFTLFDAAALDEFRQTVSIDGLEAHYPLHTPEQTAMYQDYARQHGLLVSSGSDSHRANKLPIRYRAELSRGLLERLGVQVA